MSAALSFDFCLFHTLWRGKTRCTREGEAGRHSMAMALSILLSFWTIASAATVQFLVSPKRRGSEGN
ncbi:hypothetical protein K461DRAFT_110543 [Myriangium duriaei CBS 260.36]|uniref:Uncharacterized protein n=1 Tax=Myriangium duriaei CBS 260.36 TaxID=1168546 RepID=A0A9P4MJF2_9PEZI|nr:hypothetical protein K461DRAFT_110543 [Myriangium duriaei CBS 260.36]